MSMLLVHAACSCCLSMQHVHFACQCAVYILHVYAPCSCPHAVCPFRVFATAFPCFMSKPSHCMSMLQEHFAWKCYTNMKMNMNIKINIKMKKIKKEKCCMYMLLAHATCHFACPLCMPMLHVRASCPCSMSMYPCFTSMSRLLVHYACSFCTSFCMPMLHFRSSCPCSMPISLCCWSILLIRAACLSCISFLHVHAEGLCLVSMCPCCRSMLSEHVAQART